MIETYTPTTATHEAAQMCDAVMSARPYCRIGQITGYPGTGKSALTKWLAAERGALRIEVWTRISDKDLMRLIAEAANRAGLGVDPTGTGNTLFKRLVGVLGGRLLIVDEANHLKWAQLEILRGLSDLGGCGLLLVGTDLLAQTMSRAGVSTYLAQLRQRIGAKRIVLEPMAGEAEIAAYCLTPRFGKVSRKTAGAFLKATDGYWRSALELGDACERLMTAENIEKLDETVVQTAAAWMAGAK